MAEAFLQVLLDNLTCFIQGELGLILGFKDEFEKLQSTFTTIQAVLEDAQKKQLKDKAIENWLQKLNSAAYEADDILDECKTEAPIRHKKNKYGCYDPNITFRHKIGKRMKNIMEKLDDIAAERIKFHLGKHYGETRCNCSGTN
uniref:NBS-LRR resistance protein n=1 Tax=Solanum tuberosum TaxID=4113 RepID=M1BW08_SOLTU